MLLLENKRHACRRDGDLVLDPSFDTRRFHHFYERVYMSQELEETNGIYMLQRALEVLSIEGIYVTVPYDNEYPEECANRHKNHDQKTVILKTIDHTSLVLVRK